MAAFGAVDLADVQWLRWWRGSTAEARHSNRREQGRGNWRGACRWTPQHRAGRTRRPSRPQHAHVWTIPEYAHVWTPPPPPALSLEDTAATPFWAFPIWSRP